MNLDLITEKIVQYLLLQENNKEAAKKNLLKAFDNNDTIANEWFEKLLSLDPTREKPNPSYINKFSKFFVENPTKEHFSDIQDTLDKFNILLDKKVWKNKAKKSDINSFRKFDEFKTEVNRIFSEAGFEIEKNDNLDSNIASAKKTLKDIFEINVNPNHIMYADEDVISVIANQFKFAKQYGSKFSKWCTTQHLNHFNSYKYDDGEINSMYFAYFPKIHVTNNKDPESVIHFSLNDENEISYTDRNNNQDYEMDLSELKSEKYFKNEFENKDLSKIFPYIKPTELEEKITNMSSSITDEEFIRLSDIEKSIFYSIHDTKLSLKMVDSLSNELKNDYVEHMAESDELIDLIALCSIIDTQAGRRYINKIDDVILEGDILDGLRFISNHYKLNEIKKYKDELLKIPFVKKVIDKYIESGKLSEINHIFNLRTKQKIFYNITNYIDTFEDFDYVVNDPRLKQTIQKLSKYSGKNPTKLFQFALDERDLINFIFSYDSTINKLPNEINIVNQTKRKDKSKHIIDTLFVLMENFNSSEKINILKNYIVNLNNSFPSILYIFKKLKSVNVNQMQLQDLLVSSVSYAAISITRNMRNSYKNFFIIFKELNILKEFNYETIRKLSNSYEDINNTKWEILEYLIDNFTPESKVYNKFNMFTAMFEYVDEDKSLVENLIKYCESHINLIDTISNFIRLWYKYNPDKKYEFDTTNLTNLISVSIKNGGNEKGDILVRELEKISGTNILNTIISSMNNELFGWLKKQDEKIVWFFLKKFNNYELKYEIHDKDFNNFKYIIKEYIFDEILSREPLFATLWVRLHKFGKYIVDSDNLKEYDKFLKRVSILSDKQHKIGGDTWRQIKSNRDRFFYANSSEITDMLSEQLYKKYTSNLLNYIFN